MHFDVDLLGRTAVGRTDHLRITDLQPTQNRIFVRGGKGKKDRCTILSQQVFEQLQAYIKVDKPVDYLFKGQSGGKYSDRSVQEIFTRAKMAARIVNDCTLHSLRHSFATQLLEKGVDLRYIQALLGHESSKKTEIYTHITKKGWEKIQSPIDFLSIR